MILRKLLSIRSRVGLPGTLLSVGTAEGRHLYLEAAMGPVSVVACLEPADVEQLHEALAGWLRDRADVERPEPFSRPAPLVAGAIGRGRLDAGTVQLCTVPRDS